MSVTEVSFSRFLRDPNAVAEEASRGDVVLRRRNAPALVLTAADRGAAAFEGVRILAQVLLEIETDLKIREVMGEALVQAAPWARFLPPTDLEAFTVEFLRVLEGAAELTTFAPVGQLLHEWQATARAYADGLGADLKRALPGDGADVKRPASSRPRSPRGKR